MPKSMFEWVDPKGLRNYLAAKTPLKNKVRFHTGIFIFFALLFFLITWLSSLSPRAKPQSLLEMLLVALAGGAGFLFISLLGSVTQSKIAFFKDKVFFYDGASGQYIPHSRIRGYHILEVSGPAERFQVLILKFSSKKSRHQFCIYIEIPGLPEKEWAQTYFEGHQILRDPSLVEERKIQMYILRHFQEKADG